MIGEIIAIGDELTSGRILNTTSYFAASQLFAAGHEIVAMVSIGDDTGLIGQTLLNSLDRADFVIVTGGLGATSDDLTNEAVAEALDRPATLYPEILAKIRANQRGANEKVRLSLEKLAWLPAGAHSLKSDAQMAGHFLVHDGKPVFFLPGVPHEMKELLIDTVISRLAVWEGKEVRSVRQKLYKVMGLAETEVNRMLASIDGHDSRVRIGYYPVFPEVHISLTVNDNGGAAVDALFSEYDTEIRRILADHVFGVDDETLESIVGRMLKESGQTLAVGESCTGGLIAQRLTAIAGSSQYFIGGVVAYSNQLKVDLLGVDKAILQDHGAVSRQTALAMAEGVRQRCRTDWAISVTGIAGPGGGSPEKPVGTVYIGLAGVDGAEVLLYEFSGDRHKIQQATSQQALDILRHRLGVPGGGDPVKPEATV